VKIRSANLELVGISGNHYCFVFIPRTQIDLQLTGVKIYRNRVRHDRRGLQDQYRQRKEKDRS